MARRAAGDAVEQRARRVERYFGLALGRGPLTTGLARRDGVDGTQHVAALIVLDDGCGGAGHIDGDGDERTGEEALVKLPGLAVDIERTVPAHATPRTGRERGSELGFVDEA